MNRTYDELYEYLCGLPIIDTHEHLPPDESLRDTDTDVLKEYLTHYFDRDMVSSGLSEEDYRIAVDPGGSLEDRWKLVEPYWNLCRFTGYGRSLQKAAKGLYGIVDINGRTISRLNDHFQDGLRSGSHFNDVLSEKCGIERSLTVIDSQDLSHDKKLFAPVYQIDFLIAPKDEDSILRVQRDSGIEITSFDDWLEAAEYLLDDAVRVGGAVALKTGLAYERPLSYEPTARTDAEKGFLGLFRLIRNKPDGSRSAFFPGRAFQDFMMHFILRYANRHHLTIQFHTGLQEGSGNIISNSHPVLLSNLILRYRGVRFDLFHIGYPYHHVIGALAKNNPNVFIDMCWAHMISPSVCRGSLAEWIDTVPLNKICAFGGDYAFVDGVYGHLELARENVASVLAGKIDEGLFGMDEARWIARMLFRDNPADLFNLEPRNRQWKEKE